jgi:plasmid stabilization system protein ParE
VDKWTPDAIADARDVWDYIAHDNDDAADRTVRTIELAADRLDEFPQMGRKGAEPGTRELVVARTHYRLVYRPLTTEVEILRIIHGARDWPPKD